MDQEPAAAGGTGNATDEAAAANETLKLSIRQIAHDLSNPLGTLRMAIYFLETANPDEKRRVEYYAMITRNIDRIESLIQDLRVLVGSPAAGKDQENSSL